MTEVGTPSSWRALAHVEGACTRSSSGVGLKKFSDDIRDAVVWVAALPRTDDVRNMGAFEVSFIISVLEEGGTDVIVGAEEDVCSPRCVHVLGTSAGGSAHGEERVEVWSYHAGTKLLQLRAVVRGQAGGGGLHRQNSVLIQAALYRWDPYNDHD